MESTIGKHDLRSCGVPDFKKQTYKSGLAGVALARGELARHWLIANCCAHWKTFICDLVPRDTESLEVPSAAPGIAGMCRLSCLPLPPHLQCWQRERTGNEWFSAPHNSNLAKGDTIRVSPIFSKGIHGNFDGTREFVSPNALPTRFYALF